MLTALLELRRVFFLIHRLINRNVQMQLLQNKVAFAYNFCIMRVDELKNSLLLRSFYQVLNKDK